MGFLGSIEIFICIPSFFVVVIIKRKEKEIIDWLVKKLNYRLNFTDLVGPSSQSEKAMESRWDAIESDGIMLQMISIKTALV